MFDAGALLNQFLGAGAGETAQKGKDYLSRNAGALAGGAAAGGLAGYFLGSKKGKKISKKGKKMAKKAAKYGGMALVGGLAYKAFTSYQQQKSGTPAVPASQPETLPQLPRDSAFQIEEQGGANSFGATLVSAMIAAAKADGQIDGSEHQAIFAKIEELGLDNDEKAFLFDQLNRPLDLDSLVAAASSQEQAVEIYLASLLAIEVDTPAEQAYLSMLAARLDLEPELVKHIHSTLAQAAD